MSESEDTVYPIPITTYGGWKPITAPPEFFRDTNLSRGQQLLDAGNVHMVSEHRENNVLVRGQCTREMSVRQCPYKIEFTLNEDRQILSGRCSCISGISG